MVENTNNTALRVVNDCDIIGWIADDSRYRTPGWDTAVRKAIADGATMVMTNDLHMGAERAQANIYVHSDFVKVLGWLALPYVKHLYVDSAWTLMGQKGSFLTYLDDVHIEHMHPVVNKGEWDKQYLDTHVEARYAEDRFNFEKWVASREDWGMRACIGKLQRLKEPTS
jgi:hypothetical protein